MADWDHISNRNVEKGDVLILIIYHIKIPFQYRYKLKDFMWRGWGLSWLLTTKDTSLHCQQYFESILLDHIQCYKMGYNL